MGEQLEVHQEAPDEMFVVRLFIIASLIERVKLVVLGELSDVAQVVHEELLLELRRDLRLLDQQLRWCEVVRLVAHG